MRCPPFGITWTPKGEGSGLIRWNPCGRAVDMARRPYTTTVRPFRDSDATVQIRWYPARPEDGTLPFPSRINSIDWMTDPHTKEGVGEVWNTSRNYNHAKPIPGPKRTHVCGTEDEHGQGGLISDTRPEMVYAPSGLPWCCEPGRHEAEVPIVARPTSVVIREKVYRSTVAVVVRPTSHLTPHRLHRASVCVCPTAVESRTIRSDPYRADVLAFARPESVAETTGVYHSEVLVFARPTSLSFTNTAAVCPLLAPDCTQAPPSVTGHGCAYGEEVWEWPGPGPDPGAPIDSYTGWRRWNVTVGITYRLIIAWTRAPQGGTGSWQLTEGTCLDADLIASGTGADMNVTVTFTATRPVVMLELLALRPTARSKVLVDLGEVS